MSRIPVTKEATEAAIEADKAALRAVLIEHHGNVTAVTRALGISRSTIDRRITELGLRGWLTETYPPRQRPKVRSK